MRQVASLVTDHSVDPSYPATIATTLALHVNRAYGESYREERRVRRDGGKVVEDLAADLVAIKPQELRDHAVRRTSQVIAIAGGEDKLDAIHAAMIDPCFSTLVTDVVNARHLMRSERIGR